MENPLHPLTNIFVKCYSICKDVLVDSHISVVASHIVFCEFSKFI